MRKGQAQVSITDSTEDDKAGMIAFRTLVHIELDLLPGL